MTESVFPPHPQSEYKNKIKYLISACGVKCIVDIHGLRKNVDCDINLGINLGNNIKNDTEKFDVLVSELKRAGFSVSIDQPFKGGEKTIAGFFAKNYNVWTIQIEINCGITNESRNNFKANKLMETLTKVFKK